ncbi:MAG: GTP cyclohydrolase I FolE [Sodaliphilus sp.]
MDNNSKLLNPELIDQIAEHYKAILQLIGEDPAREGLLKTPHRAAKALLENTVGYQQSGHDIIKAAIFEHPGSKMVVVKDIEFYSQCEHHILPFFGTVSIGYLPNGKIVGLSKLARMVNAVARRLQVQERLTAEICTTLAQALPNKGVIVRCQAQHLCMKMRGVENQQSTTVTLEYTGNFQNENLRNEFFDLIK